ncbi:MAG TPA: OB-fold domain-containing protein [Acidimicrobiia bacterium]
MSARPIHEGLFEVADDGSIALIGGYSPASAKYHFPLLDTCPYSGARDVERVALSSDATLWAWTAVTSAPPGYTGRVPYGFGVVELVHERLRVITRLRESDPARLEFGQPLTLVTEDLPDGAVTWAFA